MRPIPAVQLGDRTFEAIRAAIVSGELAPRQALVDRQLAEQLQVSRTPVREALHRLEADGFVQPRGRAGWEVADFTEQDVRELFQLRVLLEPIGLDVLAKSPDDALVERVRHVLRRLRPPGRRRALRRLRRARPGLPRTSRRVQRQPSAAAVLRRPRQPHRPGSALPHGVGAGRADDTLDEHRAVATGGG